MQYTRQQLLHTGVVLLCVLLLVPGGFLRAEGPSVSTDPTLTNGIVSYWPMDEIFGTRHDVHGTNDLMDHSTVESTTGIQSYAANFESDNTEVLSISDTAQSGLDLGAEGTDFSVSMWVKPESIPTWLCLFNKWDDTGQRGIVSVIETTTSIKVITASTPSGPPVNKVLSGLSFNADTWYHLVFIYDANAGTIGIYKNGSLAGKLTDVSTSIANNTASFNLGGYNNAFNAPFDGLMDEIGIWNRALTADEVVRLYNGGVGIPYGEMVAPPPPPPVSATSSVAFLPGIMASRLYKPRAFGLGEDQLWESLKRSDVLDIDMNDDGTSMRSDIYTRDAIDYAVKLTGNWSLGGEGYAGFFDYLDTLKDEAVIHDWQTLPYDWRLALEVLRTQGSEDEDDNVSYLVSSTTPYLYQELNRLADESPSGKVSIIAHSNGGLVAKYLLKKLEETNDPLFAKIDKLILVGSPQLGTPKAIGELLHGTIPVVRNAVREVSENMPGAYQLIPSRAYFEHAEHPLITVDSSVGSNPRWSLIAGRSITTYDDMRTFLTGWNGSWLAPHEYDSDTPNVLNNTLLSAAQSAHDLLDDWSPGDLKVVQVAATGIDTPDRVVYYDRCSKHWCSKKIAVKLLEHEYWMSRRGDGTVMGGSATGNEDVTSYYVEFDEYNRVNKENRRHMDMLSARPIQKLIRQELTNDTSILPEYVTEEEQVSDEMLRYRFRVYSPVDLHLTDTDSRHTGVTEVEEGELGRTFEEELPNSYYLEWGDVKYAGVDGEQGPVRVRLDGTGAGTFRLEIERVLGDVVQDTLVFDAVPVTAAASGTLMLTKGGEPVLVYDLDGNGTVDARIAPGASVGAVPNALYFGALKEAVRSSAMPAWLKLWINARLVLAEAEVKKGKKGNLVAAQAILKTVVMTIERQTPANITEGESEVLRELLDALMASVK